MAISDDSLDDVVHCLLACKQHSFMKWKNAQKLMALSRLSLFLVCLFIRVNCYSWCGIKTLGILLFDKNREPMLSKAHWNNSLVIICWPWSNEIGTVENYLNIMGTLIFHCVQRTQCLVLSWSVPLNRCFDCMSTMHSQAKTIYLCSIYEVFF